jgi:hypothetical protein
MHEIHHVTGNIGRGGMALLIPPAAPQTRESTPFRPVGHLILCVVNGLRVYPEDFLS